MRTTIFLLLAACLFGVRASAQTAQAAAVDAILSAAHQSAGITPTATCDDRTFLRRITLDLLGRVPTTQEIENFAAEDDRSTIIDSHLASEEFSRYWSQLWTTIFVGRGQGRQVNREALRRWLQAAIVDGKPLDQMAFDLISAEGVTVLDGQVNFLVANREDPITPVSRIFLGVQLDCARCHDHPFDRWTQDDYVSMRRFFSPIQLREVSGGIRVSDRSVGNADSDSLPRFLTGARPQTTAWRREMALMTVRCQPFARSMGNRVWQLLLGRGVVAPIDGLSQSHPPSVPALHQALADQLRSQGFDLRLLIRTICSSDAYSRCDVQSAGEDELVFDLFAARRPRPLLPEQLVASYATITNQDLPDPVRLNQLAIKYTGQSSTKTVASDPLDIQRTSQGLLQELAAETSTPSGGLDSIFIATLGRRPDAWERERMQQVSASDLLYALLHCNEFIFSH